MESGKDGPKETAEMEETRQRAKPREGKRNNSIMREFKVLKLPR